MEYSIPSLMIRKFSVSLSKCPQLEKETGGGFNVQQWSRLELNLNRHANGAAATRGAQPRVAGRIFPGQLQHVSPFRGTTAPYPLLCADCTAVIWASGGRSRPSAAAEGNPRRGTE